MSGTQRAVVIGPIELGNNVSLIIADVSLHLFCLFQSSNEGHSGCDAKVIFQRLWGAPLDEGTEDQLFTSCWMEWNMG